MLSGPWFRAGLVAIAAGCAAPGAASAAVSADALTGTWAPRGSRIDAAEIAADAQRYEAVRPH